MGRTVFLSYVYEDHGYRDQIIDWARRGLLGNIEIVTETDDVRQGGDPAVKAHIRPKLRAADAILVLVGLHHAPGQSRTPQTASVSKRTIAVLSSMAME